MRSIFAERVSQGFYINVEVNRAEAARYGLTVADVQRAVTPESAAKTSPKTSKVANGIRSTFAISATFETSRGLTRVLMAAHPARRFRSEKSPRFRSRAARR